MVVRCHRCDTELEAKRGLLAQLGFGTYDGYACTECGTVLCDECYRKRRRELPGNYDRCPVCGGRLESR